MRDLRWRDKKRMKIKTEVFDVDEDREQENQARKVIKILDSFQAFVGLE